MLGLAYDKHFWDHTLWTPFHASQICLQATVLKPEYYCLCFHRAVTNYYTFHSAFFCPANEHTVGMSVFTQLNRTHPPEGVILGAEIVNWFSCCYFKTYSTVFPVWVQNQMKLPPCPNVRGQIWKPSLQCFLIPTMYHLSAPAELPKQLTHCNCAQLASPRIKFTEYGDKIRGRSKDKEGGKADIWVMWRTREKIAVFGIEIEKNPEDCITVDIRDAPGWFECFSARCVTFAWHLKNYKPT